VQGAGVGAALEAGATGPVHGVGPGPGGVVPAGNTNGGWTIVSVGNEEKRSRSEAVGGGEVVE
jgi:hypothetical protein